MVGGTLFLMNGGFRYWSSTEISESYAWPVTVDGSVGADIINKSIHNKVRSIRAF